MIFTQKSDLARSIVSRVEGTPITVCDSILIAAAKVSTNNIASKFHQVAGVETDPNGFSHLCPLETLREHQRKMVEHSKTWWAIEKTLTIVTKALRQRVEEADRLRKAARLGLPHARGMNQ